MSLPSSGNEPFDCLSALSVILDLANGLAEDKSLLTAVMALELARGTGESAHLQWQVALAALVRHLGCTAYAPVEATLAEDDIALRAGLHRGGSGALNVAQSVLGANSSLGGRAGGLAALVTRRAELERDWTREACGAARILSNQLGLGPVVARALDEVFERFDGAGSPGRLNGEGLSTASRLAQAAHTAVVGWLTMGEVETRARLKAEAGRLLDPRYAEAACGLVAGEPGAFLEAHQERLLGLAREHRLEVDLIGVAAAFGDFADLQVPDASGHARTVAKLVSAAADRLGLTAAERREVALAAHLHDLGQVAVPTSVWLTPRAFRASERERARTHVYFTERVLRAAAPLEAVARVAAAHHERLDGSGYHHGARDAQLSRTARLLAAADVWCGLTSNRPHRRALSTSAATQVLREEVRDGRLDAACVDALLGIERGGVSDVLTTRELDVLRELAQGRTNKEIAAVLGISSRTVQHHTIHIYEKLGVETRAAATLIASQRGLLLGPAFDEK